MCASDVLRACVHPSRCAIRCREPPRLSEGRATPTLYEPNVSILYQSRNRVYVVSSLDRGEMTKVLLCYDNQGSVCPLLFRT